MKKKRHYNKVHRQSTWKSLTRANPGGEKERETQGERERQRQSKKKKRERKKKKKKKERERERVCVCVCVRERERESERLWGGGFSPLGASVGPPRTMNEREHCYLKECAY